MLLITKQGFCPGCLMTKRVLKSLGVKFTIRHIKDDTERNHVLDLGFKQFPIVCPDDEIDKDTFSGFHPAKLHQLAKEQK